MESKSVVSDLFRKFSPASSGRDDGADIATVPPENRQEPQEEPIDDSLSHRAETTVADAAMGAPADTTAGPPGASNKNDADTVTTSNLTKNKDPKSSKAASATVVLIIEWESGEGMHTGKPTKDQERELVDSLKDHRVTVGSTIWCATKLSVYKKRENRALLTSAGVAIGCAGVVLGGFLLLLLQSFFADNSMGTNDSMATDDSMPPPSAPPNDVTLVGGACLVEPPATSPFVRSIFVPTFFNLSCIADGGTGDPCDAHVAEEYTHRRFAALRIVSLPLTPAYRCAFFNPQDSACRRFPAAAHLIPDLVKHFLL